MEVTLDGSGSTKREHRFASRPCKAGLRNEHNALEFGFAEALRVGRTLAAQAYDKG